MGLERAANYQQYWNTSYNRAIFVAIQFAVRRFEQIRRFLKINDPQSEPEEIGQGKDFWRKIEPFVQGFRAGCLKYYTSRSYVSIDELLVKSKWRSRHTMNIAAKAGGKGFKIYAIACGDYLIDFLFSFKVCNYLSSAWSLQLPYQLLVERVYYLRTNSLENIVILPCGVATKLLEAKLRAKVAGQSCDLPKVENYHVFFKKIYLTQLLLYLY